MRLVFALGLFAAACASVPLPAAAPTPAPTPTAPVALAGAPLEACGRLTRWIPPTATGAGSVTIGSATHSVDPGAAHRETGFEPAVGVDLCLFGGLDGQTAVSVGAGPIESPFCGPVVAFTPPFAATAGSVTILHFAAATLRIPPGVDIGTPPLGARRCFSVATDTAGDATVRARVIGSAVEMDLPLWCGTVTAYRPATATEAGTLGVGSKTWLIAAGIAHDSAYPKYRGDQTKTGEPMCLAGAVDDAGRLIRYFTSGMPDKEGGRVTSYIPATADRQGTLVLSYRYLRAVARGATLDARPGAYACVRYGLDATGDRVATGTLPCPEVQVN